MEFKIEWLERKSFKGQNLLDVSCIDSTGYRVEGTIWEKEIKTGVIFPNFSTLAPGHTFEANPYKNPRTEKITFYAPKEKGSITRAPAPTAAIRETMDIKKNNIAEAQDRKEEGIRLSGAMRDATLIVTALLEGGHIPSDDESIKSTWRQYREFFLSEFDARKNLPF